MDICSGPCRYYYIRDPRTSIALGVIQFPVSESVPDEPEIIMTGISSLAISNTTGSRVEWMGTAPGRSLEFLFRWTEDDFGSDAFPFIIDGSTNMPLEQTTKEEAETAMVMGHLDHFKATGMNAHDSAKTIITFTYQGKIEPSD
jgi:hypothetical protein